AGEYAAGRHCRATDRHRHRCGQRVLRGARRAGAARALGFLAGLPGPRLQGAADPRRPAGGHRLEPHALHIWPRGGYMMMAMANVDGSFTVTLYLGFDGPDSFSELVTPEAVDRFFQREFPDAV